jgi:hypothetical protein
MAGAAHALIALIAPRARGNGTRSAHAIAASAGAAYSFIVAAASRAADTRSVAVPCAAYTGIVIAVARAADTR